MDRALSVLFLCTGNSARSQLGEALLRKLSHGRVHVFSAGTAPQARVHPVALQVLAEDFGIDGSDLTPKHLDRFGSNRFDLVITVCDDAAEACPVFPNAAARLHWGFPDPAKVAPGPEQRAAFAEVANELARRLREWLAQPDVALRLNS